MRKLRIKKIDIDGMNMLLSQDNPDGMITMPQYIIEGYVKAKQREARLIELDLLEQAINTGWDMNKYKLHRLTALTSLTKKGKK